MRRWLLPLVLSGCADLIGISDPQDLALVELEVSNGTLEPAFDPAITRYDVTVGYAASEVEIRAAASAPSARVEIAGSLTPSGTAIAPVTVGESTLTVVVRSDSGVAVTYQVVVHRADLVIDFAPARSIPTGLTGILAYVSIADLDGDGTPDLAPVSTAGVQVMTNDGGANFTPRGTLPNSNLRGLTARDLDGDGTRDLVAMDDMGLRTFRGTGSARFEPGVACGAPAVSSAFVLFRFDADVRPDIAVVNHNGMLSPMLGQVPCFYPMPAIDQYVTPEPLAKVISGHLDLDDREDLASFDQILGRIYVHSNVGGGGLSFEALDLGPAGRAIALEAADLDGDDRDELIWIDVTTGDVVIENHPGPPAVRHRVPRGPRALTLVDVDGDGALDIVVRDAQGLTVLHNEGGRTFLERVVPLDAPATTQIELADLDGDGRADLVSTNGGSTLSLRLGVTP